MATHMRNPGKGSNQNIYWGSLFFPLALLAATAPLRPNCVLRPSRRWVAFRFLTTIIWKQVALPCLEAMTDHARKSSQIYAENLMVNKDVSNITQVTHDLTYPEPTLTVFGLNGVEVAEPVAVPSPEGSGVVHTDSVNTSK